MDFDAQLECLSTAYGEYRSGNAQHALLIAMPVIREMNRELFSATQRSNLSQLKYKWHQLDDCDQITVMRAPAFAKSPVDTVTVISWNKHWFTDDAYTSVGQLVRLGKQYGIEDRIPDQRAIRSLGLLSSVIAKKMCGTRDKRLVVSVPSSSGSLNTLPAQIVDVVAELIEQYEMVASEALIRSASSGPIKDLDDQKEREQVLIGALDADSDCFDGRSVLLVDDLLETGATLKASAAAIKRAGAKEVHALAMVKTRRHAAEVMCSR